MKHEYIYVINDKPCKIPRKNIYTFNNNKVRICILKKGISISYSADEEKNENIFDDAVKKAMLIYIIKYSAPLKIKQIFRTIDGKNDNKNTECFYYHSEIYKEERFVYSLAEDKFQHKMPEKWRNDKDFIENLLEVYEKSEYQCIISSLSALILSKTKKYESERFIWLWTAVNGMYNFFWNLVKKNTNTKSNQEVEQIWAFAEFNGLKTDFTDGNKHENNKLKIYKDVIKVINENWHDCAGNGVTRESLQSIHIDFARKIEEQLYTRCKIKNKKISKEINTKYDLDAYTYLFLDMAYYYRCNIFHADKPVKLFSLEEEAEVKMLKVLNNIMENYVENNLADWFNNDYLENILKPKAVEVSDKLAELHKK